MFRHTPLHLACLLVGLGFGCSDSSEPAGTQADAGDDATLNARWQCSEGDESERSATVRYNFQVIDFVSRLPKEDVQVKACKNSDVSCDEPVTTFVDTTQTGRVQLELPTGFVGFLEVSSDNVDTLLYITNPIVQNTVDRDLAMPTPDSIELFAFLLEYPWEMDKGIVVLEVLDCAGAPQEGIHFSSHGGGDPFYILDGVPIKDAKTTVLDPAAGTAEGGFINVPAGSAQFSAQMGTGPDALQLGTFDAQIRPRTMTIVELRN